MKTTFKKSAGNTRLDIYERVTEIVLKPLEDGVAPWQSPSIARVGFPRNYLSKHFYQGINVFLLASAGYASPWFLTYKQAQQMGGQVRKGEKGHLIVKYGTFEKEGENPKTGEDETTRRGYLRGYTVFNASQIDGIDFPEIKHPEYQASKQVALAQGIIEHMPQPQIEGVAHSARATASGAGRITARFASRPPQSASSAAPSQSSDGKSLMLRPELKPQER